MFVDARRPGGGKNYSKLSVSARIVSFLDLELQSATFTTGMYLAEALVPFAVLAVPSSPTFPIPSQISATSSKSNDRNDPHSQTIDTKLPGGIAKGVFYLKFKRLIKHSGLSILFVTVIEGFPCKLKGGQQKPMEKGKLDEYKVVVGGTSKRAEAFVD